MDASPPRQSKGGQGSGERKGRGDRSSVFVGPSMNLGAAQPISHAIMFYVLVIAALILFTPCALVPMWRHVQELNGKEREIAGAVAQLRQQIERNQEHIEALQADPQVIGRVARRELNKTEAGEQRLQWSAEELAALRLNLPPQDANVPPELPPVALPPWVERVQQWLPAWADSDLFAKSPNRTMILVMAGALLVAAFVLYTPKAEAVPGLAEAPPSGSSESSETEE